MRPRWLWVTCLGVAGCAAQSPAGKGPGSAQMWFERGNGYYAYKGEPALVGVGRVDHREPRKLALAIADIRARAEVAKLFDQFSASLVGAYVQSIRAPPASEWPVGRHIKTLGAYTLKHTQVTAQHFDEEGQVAYAQAVVPLSALIAALPQMHDLDPDFVAFARNHAARIFSDVAARSVEAGLTTPR